MAVDKAAILSVGPCVRTTRFPRYAKCLQRERRLMSEGVEARIHRQQCVSGGRSVYLDFAIPSDLKGLCVVSWTTVYIFTCLA